jgi:heptosyltransferase-2
MLTPTLQNIENIYPDSEIILVGTKLSLSILEGFNFSKEHILNRKGNRFKNIYQISKKIGKVDISISFRTSFFSGLLQLLSGAKIRVGRSSFSNRIFLTKAISIQKNSHQVEKYLQLLDFTGEEIEKFPLKLKFKARVFEKPTLGINAGATYGSAKRWYPEKFAEVIKALSNQYDITLFGGENEIDINRDIESQVLKAGITNIRNLAGKTSIRELAENIGGLSLFITNDSGPMHIAGAYQIPTVAIFGSTDHTETDQWKNPFSRIVRKEISCSPCKKRECPLKHHECMKMVSPEDVLKEIETLKQYIKKDKNVIG